MAARLLVDEGHDVTLHARNDRRAADARAALPAASGVLTGDLASIQETRSVAEQANAAGRFDAALASGRHFYHRRDRGLPDEVHASKLQDALLDYCAALTGVTIADERRQPQGR